MRMPALAIIGQIRAIGEVCPRDYWLPEERKAFADAIYEAAGNIEQAISKRQRLPKGDAA
ncbi:hypothetical protein [Bradyrhizobium sp. Ai1a-2]|uniref:hypothetical protein n=1 Tax=Bradyrhizobium sp. Ai1a-2 TaxID=196490 RepID=UPI0003F6C2D7|nr:hypothetical protein [Bradyrhizobium sp. Ai1a-2]